MEAKEYLENYCINRVFNYLVMDDDKLAAVRRANLTYKFDCAIYDNGNKWWRVFFNGLDSSNESAVLSIGIAIGRVYDK